MIFTIERTEECNRNIAEIIYYNCMPQDDDDDHI